MHISTKIILFITGLLSVYSCQTMNYPSEEILNRREEVRSQLVHIDETWVEDKEVLGEVFYYINDTVEDFECYPLWIDTIGEKISMSLMRPKIGVSKKYVLLIHGYMGNTRGFRYIITDLLNSGYGVITLNLPGHSIAGGKRGDIDDFNLYGEMVHDVVERFKSHNIDITYAITHSTGCSALVIYNEVYGWSFEKVVFIAPLIRSHMWYPSRFGRTISRPFLKEMNTKWSGVYAVQTFPMHWFDELVKWNRTLKSYTPKSDSLKIYQGSEDDVVDWKYNLKFLEELYTYSEAVVYPEASHMLFLDVKEDGVGLQLNNDILSFLSM